VYKQAKVKKVFSTEMKDTCPLPSSGHPNQYSNQWRYGSLGNTSNIIPGIPVFNGHTWTLQPYYPQPQQFIQYPQPQQFIQYPQPQPQPNLNYRRTTKNPLNLLKYDIPKTFERDTMFDAGQGGGFGASFNKPPQPNYARMPVKKDYPGVKANFERYSEVEKYEERNKLKISFILSAIESTIERNLRDKGHADKFTQNNDKHIHVGMFETRQNMRYYLELLRGENVDFAVSTKEKKFYSRMTSFDIVEQLKELRLYAENKPKHGFTGNADKTLKNILINLKHHYGSDLRSMAQEILDVFELAGNDQLHLNFKCYNDSYKHIPKEDVAKIIEKFKEMKTSKASKRTAQEQEYNQLMFKIGVICGSMDSQKVQVPQSRLGINRKRGMKRKMRGVVNESPLQKRQYELDQKIRKYEKKIAQLDELIEMKLRQQ